MIVNALYNMVDRIYVGNGVNEAALGGLTLAGSFMTAMFAFSMLFGIGTANLLSMRLGEKRYEEARNALNHCFVLLLFSGIILTDRKSVV